MTDEHPRLPWWLVAWIRLLCVLVPAGARSDWREEWLAELSALRSGRGTGSAGLARRAAGAVRDAWALRMEGWSMEAIWRDLRAAVKGWVRRPGFTLVAVLTLAVGIGANTAIFGVVDGVLIDPLPYPDSNRLVSYNHVAPGLGVNVPVIPHSEALYLHYLKNARSLAAFAVFTDGDVTLILDDEAQQVSVQQVTQPFFDVLGVAPLLGRGFAEGEDRPGSEPVAVLSYGLWRRSFGEDRSVLGRLVEMDGVRRRIVGLMPEGFGLGSEQLWIPLVIDPTHADVGSLGFVGAARLADGASLAGARMEMQDLLLRFADAHPDELSREVMDQAGLAAAVRPLKDIYVQDARQTLWILLGMVGLVLLIACANVANLFLVRSEGRRREQAVRTALGAGRGDMMRRYLVEAVTLSLVGGLLGLGLAAFGVQGLLALAPIDLPRVLEIGIDRTVLAFTLAISVAAGIFFGLIPLAGYGRTDLTSALKDGSRAATSGRERHRARSALVVAQMALALMLLVSSTLMARSFAALRQVDPGFETDRALTFRVALPSAEYPEPAQVVEFDRRLLERLAGLPGVTDAGMIDGLPLVQTKSAGPMEPEDQPLPEGELGPIIDRRHVTPGYFKALGIPVVAGRALTWDDRGDAFRGVVISEGLARAFWPGENAVGRRIRSQGADGSWEVVGVVGDVRFEEVEEEPREITYFPLLSGTPDEPAAARGVDVVVRVTGAPLAFVPPVREALRAESPRLPMIRPRSVASVVDEALSSTTFTTLLLGIAAGMALLLGTVGIYGVISYVVRRRTQEIGVRIALGASRGRILEMVLRQGLALTALGVALGVVGALALSSVFSMLLFDVSATDPLTYGAASLTLAAVALLATWAPARRAARVPPLEALRDS